MSDFKINFQAIALEGFCPVPGMKRCDEYKFDCDKCWKNHFLDFVRSATSGIIQISTQNKILEKAEKLLEGE